MLDIRLEIGQINYRTCIEAMLPPMVEHCAAKEHPGELDSFLAGLGTDAVPAACALLDRMSTDEKDEMVIWLIMSHEERLRNAANRHLAALLGGELVRIGRFIALDQPGSRITLLASQVEIDYAGLLDCPMVTEGVDRISGDNGVLKGAAKMMLSMGRLMSPAGLEKQGLTLLGTRHIKEKLMSTITEGLQQAGLDIELEDMTAQISTGGQLSQATDGTVIPADYEKKLMADMTAEVQRLRSADRT